MPNTRFPFPRRCVYVFHVKHCVPFHVKRCDVRMLCTERGKHGREPNTVRRYSAAQYTASKRVLRYGGHGRGGGSLAHHRHAARHAGLRQSSHDMVTVASGFNSKNGLLACIQRMASSGDRLISAGCLLKLLRISTISAPWAAGSTMALGPAAPAGCTRPLGRVKALGYGGAPGSNKCTVSPPRAARPPRGQENSETRIPRQVECRHNPTVDDETPPQQTKKVALRVTCR